MLGATSKVAVTVLVTTEPQLRVFADTCNELTRLVGVEAFCL